MADRDVVLSFLLSIGLILFGNYYVWSTSQSLSVRYLFVTAGVLLVSIAICYRLGFYTKRPQFAPITPIPVLLIIVFADLESGNEAVASIVVGSGLAGLLALSVLYLK
ncbi:hypothetical protein M0R89_02510 [Halorussus limi]|uniref:Uncharacterized protein n=1 Tax=Halorussus limi TaxID=2938695 RepID=A0A8U0HVK7_9EURY|nr:hypothetical protein [Halorussus limi]UPV74947.1 hypothetical protein M0R89_02510 [Halorussus limi]